MHLYGAVMRTMSSKPFVFVLVWWQFNSLFETPSAQGNVGHASQKLLLRRSICVCSQLPRSCGSTHYYYVSSFGKPRQKAHLRKDLLGVSTGLTSHDDEGGVS